MSDGEIIARVLAGDTGAFADLVRRHQDRVYGMALRTTGRPEDAEDLAQEVFLSVFRGLSGFKGDAQFTTWLYRVAWNRCADWLRRNRRPGRRTVPLDEADEVADRRDDPSAASAGRDEHERLRRAIDGLDERYRSVIELAAVQGLSYAEVGTALGLPVKTVETRLYRARKLLRERMARDA
jgi:RNA polymerase sigma-70 factor (ECF subfamily)